MKTIAGIDIGSVSVGLILMDTEHAIIHRDYRFHSGNIRSALNAMLDDLPSASVDRVGIVSKGNREVIREGVEVNEQVAIIEGVKTVIPRPGAIITIGGETFGLILFDEAGRYHKYISNSACAAGTGSFLDQQSARLNLSGSEELSRMARTYSGEPPKIATRCAVFAKTDLVHLQQQGYSLNAIAAGLCSGMAQNICDTLFHGINVLQPVAVTGGVSRNISVIEYLQSASGIPISRVPDGELMGAIGAAVVAAGTPDREPIRPRDLVRTGSVRREYGYPPISETGTMGPIQPMWRSYLSEDVEIDLPAALPSGRRIDCMLGIDVGSTSTKALLMKPDKQAIAGFYTRTAGRPIPALQKLTRALETLEKESGIELRLVGTGTTGSGRKFIQKVAKADYCMDEITAHARAACHLRPEIDTIIEIGGQDAKFTVLRNGNVNFSVMNYVCAAGTGSFIEEQAKRLGVDLRDFAREASGVEAPMISNRCTVFMERDINHFLSLGYSRRELLAASLHSVRDNYLTKVAHLNKIGEHIAFQGATAKNGALISAFELKLGKPIYVSRFCHLTGAMGVCLKMVDTGIPEVTHFRKHLHRDTVTADQYVCLYCKNHCKINTIEVDGETLGWGYLCGRDENDAGFRSKPRLGFDLLQEHRRVFDVSRTRASQPKRTSRIHNDSGSGTAKTSFRRPGLSFMKLRNRIEFNAMTMRREIFSWESCPAIPESPSRSSPIIGLIGSLTMAEYLPFWEMLFKSLDMPVTVSESSRQDIRLGRAMREAEFCAPLTELHGHAIRLVEKVDYVFMPQILEVDSENDRKFYCYYTHYAGPAILNMLPPGSAAKIIAPVMTIHDDIHITVGEIYRQLPKLLKRRIPFGRFEESFLGAWEWFRERKEDLQNVFRDQMGARNDISVVLLGRPYLFLNRSLNHGIPERLVEMDIQTFHMDMIPVEESKLNAARDFLQHNHWHYADTIMRVAETAAQTQNLFPVFLTAFRCSPDSFILPFFREIMDYYRKPYLILQLDDHEAGEGYDSRLEAAVETFRSHTGAAPGRIRPVVLIKRELENKTYLLPEYDKLTARLITAAFDRAGIRAVPILQSPEIIRESLQINDGQCLPISVIVCGIRETVRSRNLDPSQTALFINSDCSIACNLPQYPVLIRQELDRMGRGLERVDVMVSRFLMGDLPWSLQADIYMAYILSGLLQKILHRIRPRASDPESVDALADRARDELCRCICDGESREDAFGEITKAFQAVPFVRETLPQVGIVGDLYVRDNETFNRNLIREIEGSGAEAVTVPFVDAVSLTAHQHFEIMKKRGEYFSFIRNKLVFNAVNAFYHRLRTLAAPILKNEDCRLQNNPSHYLGKYHMSLQHVGEVSENLLKIFYLRETCPDLKFIINVNPMFCCPGLISEAICRHVEKDIGIPIVSITFDGTLSDKHTILRPYLHFLHAR
ncbi:hypothetical protein JXA40_09635 [bacterium]|nr:hypothetical protein [candidate division CSSED10-310 bacterium]